MAGRKYKRNHQVSLPAPPDALGNPDANEIMRAWIVGSGLQVSLSVAFAEPAMWGMALVDIARHVARMYADQGICSYAEAMDQVQEFWDAEIDDSTEVGVTERHAIQ